MPENDTAGTCPVLHTALGARSNRDWWPNQLDLHLLDRDSSRANPMDEDFDYAKEFASLDLGALNNPWKNVLGTRRGRGCPPSITSQL